MQDITEEFDIVQLIYCSRAVVAGEHVSFEQSMKDVITLGQIQNFLYDITGALMTDGEMFAQVIEGPAIVVDKMYSKISKDKRHTDVIKLRHVKTHVRLFNYWPIAFLKVEDMSYIKTLNDKSTLTELRNASVAILKALRPVLLR